MKFKKNDSLDGDKAVKNTLRSHLGAFILSNSSMNMINFCKEINGLYNNSIFYGEPDRLKKGKKYWDVLDKTVENLCQSINDCNSGGSF